MIALFVYGTLRVGEPNFRWVERHLEVPPIVNCLADGQMSHVWGSQPIFPVVRFDLPGTVWGDLLFMESSSQVFEEIAWMEEGAGYLLRQVPVLTPDNELVQSLAWHYPSPAGARILSGDWLQETCRKSVRQLAN